MFNNHMADPLSVSASIAGLVHVAGAVFQRSFTYVKTVRSAPKEVSKLKSEIGGLYGVLTSLSLLIRQLEEEEFDPTIQADHLHSCYQTLEKVQAMLDKYKSVSGQSQTLEAVKAKLKWPFAVSDVEDLIHEIQRHKSTLSLALAAEGMSNVLLALSRQNTIQNSLDEIKVDLRQRREAETRTAIDKEQQKILDSIGPITPHKNHEMSLKLRHPATGLWFIESGIFERWLKEKNARLWIYGIPGAGKTVMCSSVIQAALRQTELDTIVTFFYCDYKNTETQNPSNILGALASQIARQNQQSLKQLKRFYQKHNPDDVSSVVYPPEDLRDLIVSMVLDCKCVMIVVDALDECDSQTWDVVDLLASLSVPRENCDVRTLFLSREEQEIRELLVDFVKVSIAAQSSDLKLYVAAEVETRTRRRQLRIKDQSLKEHIVERLVAEADGMYVLPVKYMSVGFLFSRFCAELSRCLRPKAQNSSSTSRHFLNIYLDLVGWMLMYAPLDRFRWVSCQMDLLCELPTDADRRSALRSLPPTLNATYERILRRVNKSNKVVQKLVRRTLQWVVHALYPLSISALCQAVSVEGGCDSLNYDAVPAEDEILRWCSSLVRKTASGDALELAHFTVKEFLVGLSKESASELAIYGLHGARDDIDLGVVCLTVLLAFDPVYDDDSLWTYAIRGWAAHAEYSMADSDIFSLVKRLMDPSQPKRLQLWAEEIQFRDQWVEELSDGECLSTAGPLHYASLLALPQVCSWLIEQGCDVNEASQLGTPLHCALLGYMALTGQDKSQLGSTETPGDPDRVVDTIRVILSAGGDARSPYNAAGNLRTPLYMALILRNEPAYMELLGSNAVLDHDSLNIIRPERAYQVLENVGEGQLSYTNHAALVASALQSKKYRLGDTLNAVDRRLEADQNALDKYNECWWYAAKFGQVQVISQLLNKFQLDINARDLRNGFTALHYAAESGHSDAIKLLMQQGADHTVVDLKGKTPFSFLIETVNRHDLIVYLQLDIDLSQIDGDGQSLWHSAARNKNPDVLSTLTKHLELQHHATALSIGGKLCTVLIDVDQKIQRPAFYYNIQSHDATRPLHVAAEAGSLEAVRFLLENGADLQAKRSDGSNALHCAVDGTSHTIRADIVNTLIEHGLDPASPRLDQSTPMLILLMGPREREVSFTIEHSVLQRLMQHESTLTVTDDNGMTVMHHLCQLTSSGVKGGWKELASWEYRTLELMLDNGAEMHHLDHAHRTPLKILLDVFREEYLRSTEIHTVPPLWRASICASMINATYKHCGYHEHLIELWSEPDFLVLALWAGHNELVEYLLQVHSDVDSRRGVTDLTPIQSACRFGCSASIMEVFISRSAYFSGPVSSASALVLEACYGLERGSLKAPGHLAALLDAGSDPNSANPCGVNALMLAAQAGNIEMMDLLILAGADISAVDDEGWTVIHCICLGISNNERAVFQRLRIPSVGYLSRVPFSWKDQDRYLRSVTALHIAATRAQTHALEQLLESGLVHDVDAISEEGDTALMFASTIGAFQHVKLLLSKGADANIVNMSRGQSALHIAAKNGHRETATILVRHGCDLSAKDFDGMIPAMCADKNGHRKLASILISYPSSNGVVRSRQDSDDEESADHQLVTSQELCPQARVTRRQWLSRVQR